MVDGFGSPSLPDSGRLEGTTLQISFEDGSSATGLFSDGVVRWKEVSPHRTAASSAFTYRSVDARPDILFVDFVRGDGAHSTNISLVVDFTTGQVTYCPSSFVDRNGAIKMTTAILHGALEGYDITPRKTTTELVGKRIYYRYSPTEHYEHVYLNAGTFVWHCIRGGEVGLADADPIQVFSVADGLVLLHWSETVMPVESIVLIDLQHHRSIGRMFCWDGPTLQPVRIPFDSRFKILSDTAYPTE